MDCTDDSDGYTQRRRADILTIMEKHRDSSTNWLTEKENLAGPTGHTRVEKNVGEGGQRGASKVVENQQLSEWESL